MVDTQLYQCSWCDKSYEKKASLQKHKQRKHPEQCVKYNTTRQSTENKTENNEGQNIIVENSDENQVQLRKENECLKKQLSEAEIKIKKFSNNNSSSNQSSCVINANNSNVLVQNINISNSNVIVQYNKDGLPDFLVSLKKTEEDVENQVRFQDFLDGIIDKAVMKGLLRMKDDRYLIALSDMARKKIRLKVNNDLLTINADQLFDMVVGHAHDYNVIFRDFFAKMLENGLYDNPRMIDCTTKFVQNWKSINDKSMFFDNMKQMIPTYGQSHIDFSNIKDKVLERIPNLTIAMVKDIDDSQMSFLSDGLHKLLMKRLDAFKPNSTNIRNYQFKWLEPIEQDWNETLWKQHLPIIFDNIMISPNNLRLLVYSYKWKCLVRLDDTSQNIVHVSTSDIHRLITQSIHESNSWKCFENRIDFFHPRIFPDILTLIIKICKKRYPYSPSLPIQDLLGKRSSSSMKAIEA